MSLTDLAPTRRGLPPGFVPIATTATAALTISAAVSSPSLDALGIELDACHAARRAFDLANRYAKDPYYDRHWKLREAINGLPARTYEDLRIKARAAAYALEHDPSAECDVAGSFVELSRSLIADVLRLQQSAG